MSDFWTSDARIVLFKWQTEKHPKRFAFSLHDSVDVPFLDSYSETNV